jgi:N-acylneuraminate cytidylyltransferase
MENSWKVLALIPARGGSKGIPGKNLRLLAGRPLVAHAVRNAREVPGIGRVVLSTDSEEIAEAGRGAGAEVPFLRPPALAGDESPMAGVVIHAVEALRAEGWAADAVVLLQPTSPLVRPATIERALDAFRSSGAPVLKGVRRVREHPGWMLVRRGDRLAPFLDGAELSRGASPGKGAARRQDLTELFIPCGAVYVYSTRHLSAAPGEGCAWIEIGWPESIDIDDPEDLRIAEWALSASVSTEGGAPT